MKRAFILCIILSFFLTGCEFFEEEKVELPAPQNLRLISIDNGLGVRLEWDPVEGAEEYGVYFNSEEIARVTTTYFEHHASQLDEAGLGPYFVFAYKKDETSPQSRVVSTKPSAVSYQYIYDRDNVRVWEIDTTYVIDTTVTPPNTLEVNIDTLLNRIMPGAYDWDSTSSGTTYVLTDSTAPEWDIYLDDGDPTKVLYKKFFLVSANASLPTSSVPEVSLGWEHTYITGPCTVDVAPENFTSLYAPDPDIQPEGVDPESPEHKDDRYYLKVDGDYYVQLRVNKYTAVDTLGGAKVWGGIEFEYYFQKVKNFRRFEL